MIDFAPVAWRRRSRAVVVLLVFGTLASLLTACDDSGGDGGVMAAPRGRCEGVWQTAQQQCLDANPCVGFACLFVLAQCNSDADFALAACCASFFTLQADFEQCIDTLGVEPT